MLKKLACAAAQVLGIALVLAACSEDTPPELEPGTFAGDHRAQIEYNCENAVACLQEAEPQHAEAFDECVISEARNLNSAPPASQLTFLVSFRRCAALTGCDFVLCGQAGGMGFGLQQIAKVEHTCQAKVQCAQEMNTPFQDPALFYETCLLDSINFLDPLAGAQRQAYQDGYYNCASYTGCAFTMCFPY